MKYVVAGFDFTYGYRGEGNMDRMKKDADDMLEVVKVEKIEFEGDKVSSTLIRKMIHLGRVDFIHHYLGKHYQIEGKINLNKNIAEVRVKPHYLVPASGVYEVIVSNGKETWQREAVVEQDHIKLKLENADEKSIKKNQSIQIIWLKCLSPSALIPPLLQSV